MSEENMAINMRKTTFMNMDKNLKRQVKKDVSNLELFVDRNSFISVDNCNNDGSLIVLKCGGIKYFRYPENSEKNTFEPKEQKRRGVEVEFSFNYHNRKYIIYGIV